MPLFVIMGHDVADSHSKRTQLRPSHVKRLHALHDQNRLVLAGPMPITHGDVHMGGSLIVADFETLEEARLWANDEPYLHGGVYSHVDIKPFVQVLP